LQWLGALDDEEDEEEEEDANSPLGGGGGSCEGILGQVAIDLT
jgi:hypothetical protein